MYTLYVNKSTNTLQVKKARKALQDREYTNEVTLFNNNYYLCIKRKPLVEKAEEIKQSWIEECEQHLDALRAIKL